MNSNNNNNNNNAEKELLTEKDAKYFSASKACECLYLKEFFKYISLNVVKIKLKIFS